MIHEATFVTYKEMFVLIDIGIQFIDVSGQNHEHATSSNFNLTAIIDVRL